MTAAEWARRKAAGLCGQCGCSRPRECGSLCATHKELLRVAQSKCHKRAYWEKKEQGLCVEHACREPAGEATVMCDRHYREAAARAAIRNATPRAKKYMADAQRDRRRKRKRLGLCIRCNRPAVTDTLCEKHRRELHDYQVATGRIKNGTRPERCSFCRETGHRITTCEKLREQDVLLSKDDFATARNPVELG